MKLFLVALIMIVMWGVIMFFIIDGYKILTKDSCKSYTQENAPARCRL